MVNVISRIAVSRKARLTQDYAQNESAHPDPASWVQPKAPHDAMAFDELSQRYNFQNISSFAHVLTNLIVQEIKQRPCSTRVLDVGCGRGLGRCVEYQWAIRNVAGEYWGLEPDENVEPAPGLFDHYQRALMETADLPHASFDLVYSSMVMEHVADPDSFMRAIYQCLKPGGSYLFLTPNGKSLIPMITRTLHNAHLDELMLRLLKGKEAVEKYHYPVQFRFNSTRTITACARRLGFHEPEYAFIEGKGNKNYFPGPLRPIYHAMVLYRNIFKNPRRLATLICRITKPA
ncbi:MAG: class I SAM-dependent methyltransferase [Phycisphaeraceae bacterium]